MNKLFFFVALMAPILLFANRQAEVTSLVTTLNSQVSFSDTVNDPNGPMTTTLRATHATTLRLSGGLPCGSTLRISREVTQNNRRVALVTWDVDLGKTRIQSNVSGTNWTITTPSAGVPIQQITQVATGTPTVRNLNTVTITGNSSYPSKALLIAASTVAVGNKALEICQQQNR